MAICASLAPISSKKWILLNGLGFYSTDWGYARRSGLMLNGLGACSMDRVHLSGDLCQPGADLFEWRPRSRLGAEALPNDGRQPRGPLRCTALGISLVRHLYSYGLYSYGLCRPRHRPRRAATQHHAPYLSQHTRQQTSLRGGQDHQ